MLAEHLHRVAVEIVNPTPPTFRVTSVICRELELCENQACEVIAAM